jgi:hypothetical protein
MTLGEFWLSMRARHRCRDKALGEHSAFRAPKVGGAPLRLIRKLLKKHGFAPKLLVTDKLRSYAAAFRRLRRVLVQSTRKSGLIL